MAVAVAPTITTGQPCLSPWPSVENNPSQKLSRAREYLARAVGGRAAQEVCFVQTAMITNPGSGFTAVPQIVFRLQFDPVGGTLYRLPSATAEISGGTIHTGGSLSAVTITDSGFFPTGHRGRGYCFAASVSGGNGQGATLELGEMIGLGGGAIDYLGLTAAAVVEDYAPGAPQPVKNEAVIRFAGYLAQSDFGGIVKEGIGPRDVEYTVNHASAFRNSGAGMLLSRWRVRRGGAI